VKHELRETGGNPVRFNVVIATHGRDTLLERTLRSLASASIPSGFECVFVVENGIVAGARAICDALGPALAIEYRHVERPGKGRAVQHALDEIGSGFVLFLDDDVRVGEALLTCYADELARSGPGCFLGGPLAIDYETEPPAWLHKHLPRSVTGWRLRSTSARLEGAARFLGANFGAFVEDVAAVGGFSMVLGPGALIAGAAGNPTGLELDLQDRLDRKRARRRSSAAACGRTRRACSRHNACTGPRVVATLSVEADGRAGRAAGSGTPTRPAFAAAAARSPGTPVETGR
jgi:glycosyltransferase involved in cell wall biosynthesis